MSLPNELEALLKQDGFVAFIEGKKDRGKTNFAMLLIQICHSLNLRQHFATNITTHCHYVNQIDNYPDLESWLETVEGKKLYVLDEAGKHIKKMRFMTEKNTKIMDLIQLIRHYDAGFIGVAPSSKFVDSLFLNTDILDLRIRKVSRQVAKIFDYNISESYKIFDIPRSSIWHKSKDIAPFRMDKPKEKQILEAKENYTKALDAAIELNIPLTRLTNYVIRGIIESKRIGKIVYIPNTEIAKLRTHSL